jgi:hypothetical protein
MPSRPLIVTSDNLSLAWGAALKEVVARRNGAAVPLLVSVFGFTGELPAETESIRAALNGLLKTHGCPSCDETGSTIFPYRYWNSMGRPVRQMLYDWYLLRRLPRMKALDPKNAYGTYFERMIASTGVKRKGRKQTLKGTNQLEFVIELCSKYLKRGHLPRQSALQLSIFDPAKDHTGQALRGFPCLQQVSVSCTRTDVTINAFYPVQYMFERAYGNYLGLAHLGHFVAHELGLRMTRLNCFTAIPEMGELSLRSLRPLLDVVSSETPDA